MNEFKLSELFEKSGEIPAEHAQAALHWVAVSKSLLDGALIVGALFFFAVFHSMADPWGTPETLMYIFALVILYGIYHRFSVPLRLLRNSLIAHGALSEIDIKKITGQARILYWSMVILSIVLFALVGAVPAGVAI
ncbi:MAG: hypothetical protein KDD53_05625 [Bdellovibrionales bacterium]|nr:hypothetical protein [Bdellovibrionales bacterium]